MTKKTNKEYIYYTCLCIVCYAYFCNVDVWSTYNQLYVQYKLYARNGKKAPTCVSQMLFKPFFIFIYSCSAFFAAIFFDFFLLLFFWHGAGCVEHTLWRLPVYLCLCTVHIPKALTTSFNIFFFLVLFFAFLFCSRLFSNYSLFSGSFMT